MASKLATLQASYDAAISSAKNSALLDMHRIGAQLGDTTLVTDPMVLGPTAGTQRLIFPHAHRIVERSVLGYGKPDVLFRLCTVESYFDAIRSAPISFYSSVMRGEVHLQRKGGLDDLLAEDRRDGTRGLLAERDGRADPG